jgi:hypothetical protein
MPEPIDLILRSGLDQKTINAMVIAFKDVVLHFDLSEAGPKAEIVARRIIECARMGECDYARLRELAVKAMMD